jgi:hypothetical protein
MKGIAIDLLEPWCCQASPIDCPGSVVAAHMAVEDFGDEVRKLLCKCSPSNPNSGTTRVFDEP